MSSCRQESSDSDTRSPLLLHLYGRVNTYSQHVMIASEQTSDLDSQHTAVDPGTSPGPSSSASSVLGDLSKLPTLLDCDTASSTLKPSSTTPLRACIRLPIRVCRSVLSWLRGPPEPRTLVINPVLPRLQRLPARLSNRLFPRPLHRLSAVLALLLVWAVIFVLIKRGEINPFPTPFAITGSDKILPAQTLSCYANLWGVSNSCGLDGELCRPFSGVAIPFTCPSNCRNTIVSEPYAVGPAEINYQPLVVGGPPANMSTSAISSALVSSAVYRGDSWICDAALHLGVVSQTTGGCGVVRLIGNHTGFESSTRNGITSVPFHSSFPLAFAFEPDVKCSFRDNRWSITAVSVVFTVVFALLFGEHAPYFFFPVVVILIGQIGFSSGSLGQTTIPGIASTVIGRALPCAFCLWVIYDVMAVRRTLRGLTASVELTMLWLGPCWVGALSNYTFDLLPLQRLTTHDLAQEPGAPAVLAFVLLAIIIGFFTQAWFYRQEGRLLAKLGLYAGLIGVLLLCLTIPDLSLRIHHYILALLLLSGSDMQTRSSLVIQGLFVGLFLNGVIVWDFDSILQTADELRGNAALGSILPALLPPVIFLANTTIATASAAAASLASSTITLSWNPPPATQPGSTYSYDGMSVLVNDVERYIHFFEDGSPGSFVWSRPASNPGVDEYFRFAYISGSTTLDYTRASTWTADGEWVSSAAGGSRIKRGHRQ